ncbi:ATP-binding protein [Streptomyces sp. CA2R106]|uniref:ATP-binding protein n=1 Tax=Streptomyces sp. CA2R106 TaxID=3120153 RepID=UPI0030081939
MAARPAVQDGTPAVRGPRLVGRAAELERAVRGLTAGPAAVFVEGEAGIGKTRLLQEVLEALETAGTGAAPRPGRPGRPGRVLVAGCPPFRETLTLAPVVDAVRQTGVDVAALDLSPLAGALRPLFPEWAGDLPPAPERLDDAGAARHRLFRALRELLAGCGTAVLAVEDAHWADAATLDFLLFLAARPAAERVSLVLTYRPEDVPAGSHLLRLAARPAPGSVHTRIVLAPLSVAETAQFVSSMLHDEHVSDAFAAFLHQHTSGLPLALEESVRLLGDRADLVRHGGEWRRRTLTRIEVPPTIRDAVLERAARLAPDDREVLRAAAVLAEPVGPAVLVAVSGLPAERAEAALAAAVRARALVEDPTGRVHFRHLLAGRAVYDDIPGGERRVLHLRAGRALEKLSPVPIAQLPRHFAAGGDTGAWRRYTERAADLSLASGDQPAAVSAMHALLSAPGLPAGDAARLCRKFPVYAFSGYLASTELLGVLRSLLDGDALSRPERGEIRAQLGRMLLQTGQYAAGAAELERAIGDLDDRPQEAAAAMSALSRPGGADWPVSAHRRWLDKSVELVEVRVPAQGRLTFRVDRVTALLEMGDPAGWDVAAGVPAAAERPEDLLSTIRADLNIGDAALRWGFYARARPRLERAAEVSAAHGYLRMRDMALVTLVHLDWYEGRWAGLAERAAAFTRIEQEPLMILDGLLVLALLGAAGATGEAELAAAGGRFEHVSAEAARRGMVEVPLKPTAALAAMRLAEGRVEECLALTEEGMRVVTRKGIWLWATEIAPVRVRAFVAAGRIDAAEDLLARYARGLRGVPSPAAAAALATCEAWVAEAREPGAQVAERWEAAAVAWERLPRPYEALLARERRALALGAADLLTAVEGGFRELGAHEDARRVAAVERAAPRGPRRGYGDRLSPRELEVVRLMLTGLSTPDIARALSRSPRTVAAQLNSAMRKHHVRSRTALAVAALNAGIAPAES